MKTTPCLPSAELHRRVADGNCQLIDVREPVEFVEEHIVGTKLIPLGELERRSTEIAKTMPVVVMCRGGTRGQQGVHKLLTLGFSDVQNLEGGILAWKAAGLPVECASRRGLPLMQQVQLVIGLGVLMGSILALTIHPLFALLAAFFGAGLTLAGSTGWCGLALLLAKMPWNKASCSEQAPSCTR